MSTDSDNRNQIGFSQLSRERLYAQDIVDALREALLVLDTEHSVIYANSAFYQNFQVKPEDTLGKRVYDLGNGQWDIEALRKLLEEIVPQNEKFENFEVRHNFPSIGFKVMVLNARKIKRAEKAMILLAIDDVTEKKVIEDKLKESEEKYYNLVESLNSVIIGLNSSGEIIFFNHFSEELFQYKRDELIGKKLVPTIVPEKESNGTDNTRMLEEMIEHPERYYSRKSEGIRKDGGKVIFSWSVKQQTGKEIQYIIDGNDITAVEEARREAERYQSQLRELMESANSIIVRWNPDGTILNMNDFGLAYFGYAKQELIGNNITILFPVIESGGRILTKLIRDITEHPENNVKIDTENIKKDGSFTRVVWSNKASAWGAGADREILSIGNDITERYESQRELQKREEEYISILSSTPDIIFRFNPTARIIYVNPAIESYTGNPVESCLGKVPQQVPYLQEKAIAIIENLARVFETEKKVEAEIEFSFNEKKVFQSYFVPQYGLSAKVESVIMLMHDVTEIRQATEVLKRDKETLEKVVQQRTREALRSKRLIDLGTLASTVSHELRNPLSAISAAVYNLKRKTKDESLGKSLSVIEKEVIESDKLIDNLLYYARTRPPEYQSVPLCSLTDEAVEKVRIKHRRKEEVQIKKTCSAGTDIDIQADPSQLTQLFVNVLDNAMDAVPADGGKIEIKIEHVDNQAMISISDNGPGIPEEDRDRIFEPFFTRKTQGTGLGLVVSKNIVEAHRGTLEVESRPGKGTRFVARLPLQAASSR